MEESLDKPEPQAPIEFKKPILIGRVGKLPRRVKPVNEEKLTEEVVVNIAPEPKPEKSEETKPHAVSTLPPAVLMKELTTPIPYKEPKWSGLAPEGSNYAFEVLKSGMILDKVDLTQKPYFVFGRLANSDVVMAHPTVSRHHAVLQYKALAEDGEHAVGWYLYDLGSTHGTFLNKERLKPNHYTRIRVGHMLKLGCSSRSYTMLGPDWDCEGESEMSVTEMKAKHKEMKEERDRLLTEAVQQREEALAEKERKREEMGVTWGMAEDAEEETDLADNPYATTTNEELYLDDPKKTLRGYFEREGLELQYVCEERSVGQFMCRVELPLDDAQGRALKAEVMHKGKKKEAVVACALEACRILDRAGLLRQAKHESRRRKQRDWGADDYYDSDDDSFLDRTGAVERKRRLRMQRCGAAESTAPGAPGQALTYHDLLKKSTELESQISAEERSLERLRSAGKSAEEQGGDEDALDQFMSSLGRQGHTMAQRAEISKTKMTIQKLKSELLKTQRLAEIAKPANLPELLNKESEAQSKLSLKVGHNSVVYGKRIRLKNDDKRVKVNKKSIQDPDEEFVEEVDSDEELDVKAKEEILRLKEDLNEDEEMNVGNVAEEEDTGNEIKIEKKAKESDSKKLYGPMRPPENYVMPESYFNQESDRDLPEIVKDD